MIVSAVSVKNLGYRPLGLDPILYEPVLQPGWYYDAATGWFYIDQYGNRYTGNPYTGQLYQPLGLGFKPKYEREATLIRSDAPIGAIEGDIISVSFTITRMGPAGTLIIQIGNCKGVLAGYYDRADGTNTVNVSVTKDLDWKNYSETGTFVYSNTGVPGDAPHLFILNHTEAGSPPPEFEVVYRNAFKKVDVDIKDIKISSYGRTAA